MTQSETQSETQSVKTKDGAREVGKPRFVNRFRMIKSGSFDGGIKKWAGDEFTGTGKHETKEAAKKVADDWFADLAHRRKFVKYLGAFPEEPKP